MKRLIFAGLFLLLSTTLHAQKTSSGTQNTNTELSHLKVYPAVADKYVNIYVAFDEPVDFTINMPASELNDAKEWKVKAKTTYQTSLTVSNLKNGDYKLELLYSDKKEIVTFTVKH